MRTCLVPASVPLATLRASRGPVAVYRARGTTPAARHEFIGGRRPQESCTRGCTLDNRRVDRRDRMARTDQKLHGACCSGRRATTLSSARRAAISPPPPPSPLHPPPSPPSPHA